MIRIEEIIVVEGKTDVSFLSQFIEATYLITNGLNVNSDFIQTIGSFLPTPGVIVMTDPDGPGKQIRQKILQFYPEIKNAYISASKSRSGRKVGVAQSTPEEVISALKNLVTIKTHLSPTVGMKELVDIGFAGSPNANILRGVYADEFHLGHSNAKMFLHKINSLGITLNTLIEWKEHYEQTNSNS